MSFDFLGSRPVEVEISDSPLSSDAGLLPIAQFDDHIKLTAQFAAALRDDRDPTSVTHTRLSMVRQRVYGILAGYEDQNDHDTLRSDPVFKLIAGRLPADVDLASEPTLSRFENAVSIADLWRLRDLLVDQFIQSFPCPPRQLTLDVDAFDDPAHGEQQMTFYHGFYGQNQYLPIVFTCAENDAVLLVGLRHGTCTAACRERTMICGICWGGWRAVWPDVKVHLRGDCGFGVPRMYEVCDELGLTYTFGLGQNPCVKRLVKPFWRKPSLIMKKRANRSDCSTERCIRPSRGPHRRNIVIKAEVTRVGTNRRAVVTNRPGWDVSPQGIYDEYVERGESENRNKELKCDLHAGRLSDERFLANFFRLYLHVTALNLQVRLRAVALPDLTPAELGLSSTTGQHLG